MSGGKGVKKRGEDWISEGLNRVCCVGGGGGGTIQSYFLAMFTVNYIQERYRDNKMVASANKNTDSYLSRQEHGTGPWENVCLTKCTDIHAHSFLFMKTGK